MPIDDYKRNFKHLAEKELPSLMSHLKQDMKTQRSMGRFSIDGVGVKTLCKNFGLDKDFSGCYLLLDQGKPIYVGISRSVLERLRQHVRGTTHFNASLAYRIALKKMPMPYNYTRSQAMDQKEFKAKFNEAKEYLRKLNVAYVKIDNPLVLYVFEPYCAMCFDTSKWNTFETH